ncbi:MAG TPA: hypothetical protein VFU16_03230 [Solirubrobacterales bacterium]|nr:hypothetical protein [Solirubrobacterales bacterium]
MARALGIAVALVLLAAPTAAALTKPSGKLVAGSEETVLRLHDLAPGYQVGDDSGCGPLGPSEGDGPRGKLERRYLRWLLRYWPEGCYFEYERRFEVPSLGPQPPLVATETLNTPSRKAADQGYRLQIEILDRSKEGRHRKEVTIPPTETPALLIRTGDELVEGQTGGNGTFLLWRHGNLISFLEVAGMSPRANDAAALRLAGAQQARLEAPTPYTEAERDDTEVLLDDPALTFPVYWVGRTFAPGGGLPPTELEEAFTLEGGRGGPPGQLVALWYDGLTIDLWTRTTWKRYVNSRLAEVNLAARCVSKEPLALAGGSATLYGTYDRRFRKKCPRGKPDRYYAVAHLGGMVVGVNLGVCLNCRGGVGGPYGDKRGVIAVLRALAPRPKPVYAPSPRKASLFDG